MNLHKKGVISTEAKRSGEISTIEEIPFVTADLNNGLKKLVISKNLISYYFVPQGDIDATVLFKENSSSETI